MIRLDDELYMRRCFDLAGSGKPAVRSNPLVGSCIVFENRIIGEGFHRKFGGPHAEIEALDSVAENDKQFLPHSTLYVNLAPCNHHGKTPPCSQAIIANKILRVVIGMTDTNPVATGSIQAMRNAGIEVIEDVLNLEAKELNQAFLIGLSDKRPLVTLKWAESYDGFIGCESRQLPISNKLSQLKNHDLRRQNNAILVGSGTVITDNPKLTTRNLPGSDPLRIVVEGNRKIPEQSAVCTDGNPLLLFTQNKLQTTLDKNVLITEYEGERIDIKWLLTHLYEKHEIGFLIIEGGLDILQQIIDQNLWDECWRFKSNQKLKSGIFAPRFDQSPYHKFNLAGDSVEFFKHY